MAIDQRLLWGGIAVGGAGIAIYMYQRNKKQQAKTQAAQQASASFAYGYGFGYGYGQGQSYDPYGYGFGPFGLGAYGGSGNYGYGYYGAGVPVGVQQQATTNAQWSQAAMSALSSAGYDPMTTLAALGTYLLGGNLSSQQAQIVTAAIAAEGYPPVSGASGYPPAMHTGGTTGGGQGNGGGKPAGAISNLQAANVTATSALIRWNPVSGATGYSWKVGDVASGGRGTQGEGQQTNVQIEGLQSRHTYNFGVQALPGGPGNNIHFTTH